MHYYLCLCNIGSGDVVDHVWNDLSLQESTGFSKSQEWCGFGPSCLNEGEVCRLRVVAGVGRGVSKISKCQTPVVVSSDGVGVGVGLGDQKETKCKV